MVKTTGLLLPTYAISFATNCITKHFHPPLLGVFINKGLNRKYMLNISFKGESVLLKEQAAYYLIDALYVMDIKKKAINPIVDKLEDELHKVFPYTRTPFGKYWAETIEFSIARIKKVGCSEPQINATQFSCDTGLLLIIAANLLVEFSAKFDYYELVDSPHDIVNKSFWKDLTKGYNFDDIALVLAPGVYSGFDFEGSGQYVIELCDALQSINFCSPSCNATFKHRCVALLC